MGKRWHELHGEIIGDPDNPATITVVFNNNEVYSGTAPTSASYNNLNTFNQTVLCNWSDDAELSGLIPVAVTVLNGDLKLQKITRGSFPPGVDPENVAPPPGVEWTLNPEIPNSDTKFNVRINGVSVTKKQTDSSKQGEWIWWVPSGSMIEFDYELISLKQA